MSVLSAPHFHEEAAAYDFVEAHVWPEGPVCPHCGGFERVGKMGGKSTRMGAYKCYQCRKPFTVKIGTIFEASHVPMHKWLQAIFLICSSKKGISANQLHRTLGVTLKTAWFMGHRIREAMRASDLPLMGEGGGFVEADETFIGNKKGFRKLGGGFTHKMKVMSLVERGREVRSVVLNSVTRTSVERVIRSNVHHEARLRTDTAAYYRKGGFGTADHEMVNHARGEYVRGDVYTNTLEGYFSIFKRGMKGIYQHCAEKHLHRYLAEFDFRYNNRSNLGVSDVLRTIKALEGIKGRRLYYRQPV